MLAKDQLRRWTRAWAWNAQRWKTTATPTVEENIQVYQLIQAYKSHGHLIAKIDPLGIALDDPLRAPFYLQDVPILQPETYGLRFDEETLAKKFWIGSALSPVLDGPEHSLQTILATVKQVYCGHVGTQFSHVTKPDCKKWLDQRVLALSQHEWPVEMKRNILGHIARATFFEEFFGAKLSGAKRFSLEGCESLIPGLEMLFRRSSELGIKSIEMGMTHRGRLNVLKNALNVPLDAIVYNFQSYLPDDNEHPNNSDDVRYHLGTSVVREFDGNRSIRVSLAANPSHLESVNSVVLGKTRARQFLIRGTTIEDDTGAIHVRESPKRGSVDYSPSDSAKKESMALLLHGDASFFQGSVREVLGFSNLRDYTTGGTVHILINNQIGFTTLPKESHSSIYCSDVALSIGAPIFHVNGNDPEAVAKVCETAVEYRQEFGRDCVVNIWGYRRHGHNEQDDPKLTQPIMYSRIERLPKLCDSYASSLMDDGTLLSPDDLKELKKVILKDFQGAYDSGKDGKEEKDATKLKFMWNELSLLSNTSSTSSKLTRKMLMETLVSGVDVELLRSYGRAIFTLPSGVQFNVHPKVEANYAQRLHSIEFDAGASIRWATAEALAFACLLADGFHIRLSGQDVERGTFNQRHAVIYDQIRSVRGDEVIYKPWTALQNLEWHREDIRRDMIRRVNSSSALSKKAMNEVKQTDSIGLPHNAEEEDREDGSEQSYAGHYSFPSVQEGTDKPPSNSYPTSSKQMYAGHYSFENASSQPNLVVKSQESNDQEFSIINDELDRIQRGAATRAQQRRDSRRVLRWREPREYSPELGEMEVCNSPLSEEAVLGFEHGYSLYSPNIMPVWEAQFGDFSNCAQTIIDTFIASGEEKWVRSSGIVMLLPHGYDGQGPDHSSARIERFLQLCSEPDEPNPFPKDCSAERESLALVNMHVLNMTTPAQYFHALRRHMLLPIRKPLVIFTPKYLLHHRPCSSSLEELGPNFSFQTVLQDPLFSSEKHSSHERSKQVKRVIICCGKMYYHLVNRRKTLNLENDVAIVRIEQLCPFPFDSLRNTLSQYLCNNDVKNAVELVWVQEEPRNMGAFSYVEPRIQWVIANMILSDSNSRSFLERCGRRIHYVGRPPSASTATGSFELHREEMNQIVSDGLKKSL